VGGRLDKTGATPHAGQETRLGANWEGKGRIRTSVLTSPCLERLAEDSQGFKPDLGNPAVRDYRGASGNVAMVELCTHPATERAGMVTLHLQSARPSSIPTEQLARLDRKRKKKGSNQEWKSSSDADARITRMKDGRTHLAHKAEHAVDLTSGALLALTLQPANEGDTTTIHKTLKEAQAAAREINAVGVEEVVADKGYHSGAVLKQVHEQEVRSYIPEPERGRRNWKGEGKAEEQKRTYENRRRVRGARNKRLQKLRSELTERTFAHLYETGGMRRVHLQGRNNILKRLLVHGAAFNLSLILRKIMGVGKPRRLQGLTFQLFTLFVRVFMGFWTKLSMRSDSHYTLHCKVT
jgi:transposase